VLVWLALTWLASVRSARSWFALVGFDLGGWLVVGG
jgi:hypothetical protein